MNTVVIIGRLTRDPEIRKTQNGDTVTDFNIAYNNGRDKNGNEKEPYFFRCQAWRGTADLIAQYCKKGDKVGIEGKLIDSSYTNKEGLRVNQTKIQVNRVEFLSQKKTESYQETYTNSFPELPF